MTTFVEATEMTDIENSNILRKVRELGNDIEKISFQRLQNNYCTILRLLFEPDFTIRWGSNEFGNDEERRTFCECCYGGERMLCKAKDEYGPKPGQKDLPDMYFGIDDPKGKKIDRDVYSNCIVRKLAKKLAEAYRQGGNST